MALAGLAKGETVDRQKERRERELAANTQRLSPWTGLKAGPIEEADPLGNAMAFGMAGAQLAQQGGNTPKTESSNPWSGLGGETPSTEFQMPELGQHAYGQEYQVIPAEQSFAADDFQEPVFGSKLKPRTRGYKL
jgi:hypothetical protein